jgi:hypothetical protein
MQSGSFIIVFYVNALCNQDVIQSCILWVRLLDSEMEKVSNIRHLESTTKTRQSTPDKHAGTNNNHWQRHPTNNSQQAPRLPTTDNYHRKVHPTTETDARQITFNNQNKKTIQQAKVGSNDPFLLHLSQTWSWQRHNDNVMDSTTDDRQCRSTYSM